MTRGPFLKTYLEFLIFPAPCLTCLDSLVLLSSSPTPYFLRVPRRVLVVSTFKLSITRGSSGTSITLWPLARTRGATAEAARAEATACLFCFWLIFLCHLLQVFRGANMPPFLHMFPKAPCPLLWVPDPPILGILATALPVPQDSAECWCPASLKTPWACLLFLAMLVWTNWTISFLTVRNDPQWSIRYLMKLKFW